MHSLSATNSLLTKAIIFAATVLLLLLANQVMGTKAHAAYNGARLIDDSLFLDSNSMSASQIQSFLVSKNSGLKDMKFKLQCYGAGSKERQWYTAAGAKCDTNIPASHIIYYAAKIYGVSPMVILATMQKEQSLITAPNPTNWQLSQAMGYACPTSGSCSSSSNFSYQVDSGTWVLRFHYERANGNMTWWRTDTSWTCGTEKNFYKPHLYPNSNTRFYDGNGVHYRTHNLHSAATSSMYCYTPHAYNNPNGLYGLPKYGTKGQYYTGSYNFVRFYELWFGSVRANAVEVTRSLFFSPNPPLTGQGTAASFIIRNNQNEPITIDRMVVAARDGKGKNVNFPTVYNITIGPGESYEYHERTTFKEPGNYIIWIAVYDSLGRWSKTWPASVNKNIQRERSFTVRHPDVSVTRNLFFSPNPPVAGREAAASFIIRNNESRPIYIDRMVVAARDKNNTNVNFPTVYDITLQPGESYEYYERTTFNSTGKHRIWIATYLPNAKWSSTWPWNQNNRILRERTFVVNEPNITVIRNLFFSPNPPKAGEQAAASFIIRNDDTIPVTINRTVVAARDAEGNNVNFPTVYDITLQPGESYEYHERTTFNSSGKHTIWIATYDTANNWSKTWPLNLNDGILRERTFIVS